MHPCKLVKQYICTNALSCAPPTSYDAVMSDAEDEERALRINLTWNHSQPSAIALAAVYQASSGITITTLPK